MIALNRRRIPTGEHEIDYAKLYLTLEPLESGTIQFSKACSYSLNGGAWTSLAAATNTPALSVGDKISFKASAAPTTTEGVGTFSSSCKFNAYGNPLSMRSGDSFKGVVVMPNNTYTFYRLFYGSKIIDASNISMPYTTITNYCYRDMFAGSSYMTSAPELPTMTLTTGCYWGMFMDCTSLVNAPSELPSTIAASYAYYEMFRGCTSLVQAPEILATSMAASSRNNMTEMFYDCTSLVYPPSKLSSAGVLLLSYSYMFYNCTSLVTAPDMSTVQTVGQQSCIYMFYGCTSLKAAPELPATTLGISCYQNMFRGCSALITAPSILPATTLTSGCYTTMFYDCVNMEAAPELPALTLVSNCYNQMFRGCTKLNYIKALFTTAPTTTYMKYWVYGVASSGTFVLNAALTTRTTGVNGIPANWTIEEVTV